MMNFKDFSMKVAKEAKTNIAKFSSCLPNSLKDEPNFEFKLLAESWCEISGNSILSYHLHIELDWHLVTHSIPYRV